LKKIIVWIAGGLGNQLFQYAAARSLANSHHRQLVIDPLFSLKPNRRRYKLNRYRIQAKFLSLNDLLLIKQKKYPFFKHFTVDGKQFVEVDETTLIDEVENHPDILYMRGYWQDERYFVKFRTEILNEIALRRQPPLPIQTLGKNMAQEESVSIHVRRGDYLLNSEVNSIFGVLPTTYYKNAIWKIQEQVRNPVYYIFSDDIDWVNKHFFPELKKQIINIAGRERDVYELWLMNQCRHNIIANSSFSWWGAWAGTYPGKIVIAPERWAIKELGSLSNIIPDRWIRVENT